MKVRIYTTRINHLKTHILLNFFLTKTPLTRPTSKIVGTILNTNADKTKLMPL
jgi:hypothetical protein